MQNSRFKTWGPKVQGLSRSIRNLVAHHMQLKMRFNTQITDGLSTQSNQEEDTQASKDEAEV